MADRRQVRTRKLLSDALLALLQEKPYDTITVEQITEHAQVARKTFYAHFGDKHELLWLCMEAVFDTLKADYGALDAETLLASGKPLTYPVFAHVVANAHLYRVVLSERGTMSLLLRLLSYLTEASYQKHETLRRAAQHISVDPQYTAHFLAGALLNVLIWWLEQDLNPSAEAMAYAFSQLAAPGVLEVLGLS